MRVLFALSSSIRIRKNKRQPKGNDGMASLANKVGIVTGGGTGGSRHPNSERVPDAQPKLRLIGGGVPDTQTPRGSQTPNPNSD
jgi:hypothetical protein